MRLFSLFRFALIVSIVSPAIVFAQDPSTNVIGNVTIASPTAASLGKFADYPVSYHTGLPQINIPIYTVKTGSLELPISLSYHASGLKVQEPASWVGAGWALNAGGVITRSVNGLPDDRGFPVGSNQTIDGHWADYGYNSYLTTTSGSTLGVDDVSFYQGRKDGEPDMYFFNFGKYTGKFYFRDDQTPVLVPGQDLKIVPDFGQIYTPYQNGVVFRGFTITTPDGTNYYFGNTQNGGSVIPVEVSSPLTLDNGYNNGACISSWYLNKIVSKDGLFSITLNYVQENYSYYGLSMFPLVSSSLIGQYEYKPFKQFIQGVRLSSISSPQETINFLANGSPRQDLSAFSPVSWTDNASSAMPLSAIQISNGNQLCKQYNFTYSYTYDPVNGLNGQLSNWIGSYNIQSDRYRLRLNSFGETSCDNSITIPPYQFSYYSEVVPRLLSFGIDHWGFYNGVSTNQTLIPTYTVNNSTTVTGANRDASWPAMRGGALQQITYPTGGYTQFNFEANNVYGQQTSLVNATLASLLYGMYGQSVGIKTYTFSTVGSSPVTINASSNSNYSATLTIKNSSGVTQTTVTIPNWYSGPNTTVSTSVNLAPGTYTATLTPYTSNYSQVTGGVNVSLAQMQSQIVNSLITVGGLRINSITNYDPVAQNSIVTNYTYNYGSNLSSGTLFSVPTYVCVLRNDAYGFVFGNVLGAGTNTNGCATATINGLQAVYLVSPSSVRPMVTSQGNHIGYNNVTVTQPGNGYSVYQYYNDFSGYATPWVASLSNGDVSIRNVNNTTCSSVVPSFPFAPLPFDFITGELKYEAHYNQSGQLLKDISYYPVYTQDAEGTPGLKEQNMVYGGSNILGGSGASVLWGTEYTLFSSSKTQDQKVETNYDPANGTQFSTTTTINYSSPFHHQPTQKTIVNSANVPVTSNMQYAFDYRIASADALTDSYNYYINTVATAQNNLNSYTYCSPQDGTTNNCLWIAYTNFRITKAQARNVYVQSRQNLSSSFAGIHSSIKGSADTELKPLLT